MHRLPPFALTCLALLGLGACSDSTSSSSGDPSKPPAALTVVRLAATSPPLFNSPDSFYAVKGEDRELRIFFQDPSGAEGEEFFRLRARQGSLLSRPDGTPFAVGDSVLITVRIVDPSRILFQLEPSGLSFDPAEPAELKIHYNHADHDFNEDGVVNAFDATIKTKLAIWRQELSTDPFVRLGSVNVEDLEEINANILGFTRYAIAY